MAESLDLSTSTGRMFANLLAMFAQSERERMSERRADASRKLHGIDPRTLHKRLKRVELKGWVTYSDEIVRDDEGLPVMRPPVVDARTWDRLQAKLQANSRGAGVPHDAVPWLHVIFCDECKATMYRGTGDRRTPDRPVAVSAH